jgi:hypothetical protein
MDKTQDLILGVLGGPWVGTYGYPGVEDYLVSIKRSGFTGRKVMLSWGIRLEVLQKLVEYGFEVVDLPQPSEPFFIARMRVCWEYLREHFAEFRYIFWLDIKDLVVQTDPSIWMEENIGKHKLIASTECVSIEREETNQIWAREILGVEKYLSIMNEEVINGGTWAGEAETMTEVFHQVHLECKDYKGPYPPCQITINWVMRQSPFKEVLYIPRWSESFAACLHPVWWVGSRFKCWDWLKDKHPVFDPNTAILYPGSEKTSDDCQWIEFNPHCPTLYKIRKIQFYPKLKPLLGVECVSSPKTKPFSIVHGYDRDIDMRAFFDYKYRFSGEYSLNSFMKENEETAKRIPEPRRGLRRLQRESVVSNCVVPYSTRVFRRH